jgi:hypothetical protein
MVGIIKQALELPLQQINKNMRIRYYLSLCLLSLVLTSCYSKEEKYRRQKVMWNQRIKEARERDSLEKQQKIVKDTSNGVK